MRWDTGWLCSDRLVQGLIWFNPLKGFLSTERKEEGWGAGDRKKKLKKGVKKTQQTENAFCPARILLRLGVSATSVFINNAIHICATFTMGFRSFSAAAGETGLCKQAELRVTSVYSSATCHSLKSAPRIFSRLDLTDAKGTRCEVLWQPGADSLKCKEAEAFKKHFLC